MTSRIWDVFMINDELDMLECRLVELQDVPNLVHVAIEADVDHQDHQKPFHVTENLSRFDPWGGRLRVVRATGLPTHEQDPDPWARELAQREYGRLGMTGAEAEDVVLHGDLDEIPRPVVVRNVRPQGFVAFEMACYSMAVDWQHPDPWRGTVAGRFGFVQSFAEMRGMRNFAKALPNAGWHLGWLGGVDAQLRKLGSFCHPEIADRTLEGIEANLFLAEGWHVDGKKLIPVDVDKSFPRWIRERRCPEAWFRDRSHQSTGWKAPAGFA